MSKMNKNPLILDYERFEAQIEAFSEAKCCLIELFVHKIKNVCLNSNKTYKLFAIIFFLINTLKFFSHNSRNFFFKKIGFLHFDKI